MENNTYSFNIPTNTPLSKCALRMAFTCKCGHKTNDFKEAHKHSSTHQDEYLCLKCKCTLTNYVEICNHIDNCYHESDLIKSYCIECGDLKN